MHTNFSWLCKSILIWKRLLRFLEKKTIYLKFKHIGKPILISSTKNVLNFLWKVWWAFRDFGLNCLLLHWAQVFWIRELRLVQLQLTFVWLMHKLWPVWQNFGHMPMANEAATKELWQVDKIIKETHLLLGRVNKGSLIKMKNTTTRNAS